MFVSVTESGRRITFNTSEVTWVETMPAGDPNAGKTRIVMKAGWLFCEQTQEQVIDALLGRPNTGLRLVTGDHNCLTIAVEPPFMPEPPKPAEQQKAVDREEGADPS